MHSTIKIAVLFLLLRAYPAPAAESDEWLAKARTAFDTGKIKEALDLAGKAIEVDGKNAKAYLFRGFLHESLNKHAEAIADFDQTITLDPKAADAFTHRGSEQFRRGNIAESIADFDRYLDMRPEERPGHWKRGISYYYVGRFEDGRKQFEGYENYPSSHPVRHDSLRCRLRHQASDGRHGIA